MVAMTAAVVLGVLALGAAIAAGVTWHRGADERQSVQHHQHTLETLRHVANRRQQSAWPVPGRRAGASKQASTPTPAPGSRRSSAERHGVPRRSDNGAARAKRDEPARRGTVLARWPREPASASSSARASAKVGSAQREPMVFEDDVVGGPVRAAPGP